MKYWVSIDGREIEVLVDGDQVTVDGVDYPAHLSRIPGTPLRHLLLGDRSYSLPMQSLGRGQWSASFEGDQHQLDVADERRRHIRSLAPVGASGQGGGVLKAPMPGLVVRVPVAVGQEVPAGSSLIVLEAMKMENELKAGAGCVIRTILVAPGEAVEKGQVLVEFTA